MSYEDVKEIYDSLFAEKAMLLRDKKKIQWKTKEARKKIASHIEARDLLNKSIKIIHENFKFQIEKTITESVQRIFNRDLVFELKYEEKRNRIESIIVIKENGMELNPEDDLGGSIIDIISFTFRIILWSMSSPKTRNTFILDEPFKWTGKLVAIVGQIIKELSKTLNFQVIMVTHDDELIEIADKIFKIDHINGKSVVSTYRKNRENLIT